jgi:hypothetical protein
MEPGDQHDAPVSKILLKCRTVERLKQRWMHNGSLMVAMQGLVKACLLCIHSFKEVGLEENYCKYTLTSYLHNSEENHNIKVANRPIAGVAQFRYFGTMLTNS